MIVSFAWTNGAFLAGRKSRTRREWDDAYARRFKAGDVAQAYDKSPRYGGKKIGEILIKDIRYLNTRDMTEEDYEKEGFAYMEEKGIKIWNKEARRAFEDWKKEAKDYWVIDFERVAK